MKLYEEKHVFRDDCSCENCRVQRQLFLAHTGLRYGEAMRLAWCDVDMYAQVLTVRLDKAGRSDSIPIGAECTKALRDLLAFRGAVKPKDLIFRKVSHHTLVADMERAGIPGREAGKAGEWHRFRKFMVTERLRSGEAPENVRRMARHATIYLTTGVYNDLAIEDLRGTAESFGKLNGFLSKDSCSLGENPIDSSRRSIVPVSEDDVNTNPGQSEVRDHGQNGSSSATCTSSSEVGARASDCPGREASGPVPQGDQWSRGESNPGLNRSSSIHPPAGALPTSDAPVSSSPCERPLTTGRDAGLREPASLSTEAARLVLGDIDRTPTNERSRLFHLWSAVAALALAGSATVSGLVERGITGKDCGLFNGCYFTSTYTACLACCGAHCDIQPGWLYDCAKGCLGAPPQAMKKLMGAATKIKAGAIDADSIEVVEACQQYPDETVSTLARAIAGETPCIRQVQ